MYCAFVLNNKLQIPEFLEYAYEHACRCTHTNFIYTGMCTCMQIPRLALT